MPIKAQINCSKYEFALDMNLHMSTSFVLLYVEYIEKRGRQGYWCV